eukprot:3147235-Pleurochrysis_carterae.AAC.1
MMIPEDPKIYGRNHLGSLQVLRVIPTPLVIIICIQKPTRGTGGPRGVSLSFDSAAGWRRGGAARRPAS